MPDTNPPPPVTATQFWSVIIPLIATSIILPMWQLWLSSQHESNRVQAVKTILEHQADTHAALTEAVTRQKELTATVDHVNKMVLENRADMGAVQSDSPASDPIVK